MRDLEQTAREILAIAQRVHQASNEDGMYYISFLQNSVKVVTSFHFISFLLIYTG